MSSDRTDPYAPPKAKIASPPQEKSSLAKALLVGATIDIGGSLLVGVVIAVIYIGVIGTAPQTATDFVHDPWVSIGNSAVGGGLSVLGGYVCARIAKRLELLLGLTLSAISVLVGLLISGSYYSGGMNLLLSVVTVICVMLGAWLGKRKNANGHPQDSTAAAGKAV